MAKALVGYRPVNDPRLMLETLELRRRVADLVTTTCFAKA
jgi:hypothetical protein